MNVTVFCGARPGNDPALMRLASAIGSGAAARGIGIVYGGADAGLMGAVADGALEEGGRVLGVIPRGLLSWEVGHQGITEMRVTETMHTRKQLMMEEGDAYLVLPGGIGTIDEVFEVLIAQQLGFEAKPMVLVGPGAFWAPLLSLFEPLVAAGFAGPVAVWRVDEQVPTGAETIIGRADTPDQAYALIQQWHDARTQSAPDATAAIEGGASASADEPGLGRRAEDKYAHWHDQVAAQERALREATEPLD